MDQYKRRRQAAYICYCAVYISIRLRMYDGNGEVVGFRKGTDSYYYLKNMQGDVMQIVNSSGTVVAEYEYDDWGYVTSVSGSLASTIGAENPFRYRSYYYDTETGFYYLESRYYDPETGRFISADSNVSTGQGLAGNNMFAYCNNDPVSRIEVDGESSAAIIAGALVGAFFNALSAVQNNASFGEVILCAGVGAATGAIGAMSLGKAIIKTVVGGMLGMANSIAVQNFTTGTVDGKAVMKSGKISAVAGFISSPMLDDIPEMMETIVDAGANTFAYGADNYEYKKKTKETPKKTLKKTQETRRPYTHDYEEIYKQLAGQVSIPMNGNNRWL